MLIVYKN